MDKYTTAESDTFDVVALAVYGDEMLAGKIIAANPQYSGVVMFSAGVELAIPEIEEESAAAETLPPWRR